MTEYTYQRAKDLVGDGRIRHVRIGGMGSVQVKGKVRPVMIYELGGLPDGEETVIQTEETT